MPISKILILGAGPTGLSAAIALSKMSTESNPLHITVLELKPDIQTIGGAVNLTPLAMRYLDFLGAGENLRTQGHKVAAIDLISLRSGGLLGSLWEGMDALRVSRRAIVESLLQTARSEHSGRVEVRYGMRVLSIRETAGGAADHGKVVLEFENGETLDGDLLLGCDGLHSAARRLYVEPGRGETYTGRVVAMGFADVENQDARVRKPGGEQALRSTCLVQGQKGSLLISYWEPTKSSVFLASVRGMEEPNGDLRDGWKLAGSDGEFLRKDVLQRYNSGGLQGLQELASKCEEWNLYPVYKLPPEGTWQRGRVLLLGDAAHAMPPQGESTAFAIEDGVLIAHIFSRRGERSIGQLFSDYEVLRRPVINKHYRSTVWGFENSNADSSWLKALFMEYATMAYLAVHRWGKADYFANDVKKLDLPN